MCLTRQNQEQKDSTRWLEIIKNYADIQELDDMTLNRLVQKIVIHENADSDTTRQTVEIHFNFNNQADRRWTVPGYIAEFPGYVHRPYRYG